MLGKTWENWKGWSRSFQRYVGKMELSARYTIKELKGYMVISNEPEERLGGGDVGQSKFPQVGEDQALHQERRGFLVESVRKNSSTCQS